MKTIWKFTITPSYSQVFGQGAAIRYVDKQGDSGMLWVEVDSEAPLEKRYFQVFGTGHCIPPSAIYLGSWQDPPFVWHLFETPIEGGE